MKTAISLALMILILSSGRPGASENDALLGFTAPQAMEQRLLEKRFDGMLKAGNLRDWMQKLTARPHHLGSPHGKENAEFIASLFRSWGYETQIEQFKVLFPTPKTRLLEMTAPVRFQAQLGEPALKEDSTSSQKDEQLPTYNAFSTDGDVTGELVYVNYGLPDDYEELALRGIDVKGKIVIARYGASWRGVKPKVAAEHGAIGCIIFSDPSGDGYFQGDVYPKGGWRSDAGVQRGSVMDFTEYDGDPLTPMIGATEDAPRIAREKTNNITRIPVLPISYGDALPLLKALEGPVSPEKWRGNLPIPYHMGPGPAKVHLKVEFNWNLTPAYDVIARVKGSEYPDQWIIRGNHHDGWVNGALDPISGVVALLEEARAVSELMKSGWKPKRTLIYAAWDGEEPGLLGSTEWVEQHQQELRQKAVVYINSDSNSRGFFGAAGSQTLEKFVNEVAREVQDPHKHIPVIDRMRAYQSFEGKPEEQIEARDRSDVRLPALGSGSDYTAFLQFTGVASLNIGFGGEEQYGQYHSVYDSFDHFTRFCDPNFEYGIALAKVGGRIMMRMADAGILPFEFTGFADNVSQFLKELQEFDTQQRKDAAEKNRRIDEKIYEAYFDPAQKFVTPQREETPPHLNFAPLENAVDHLVKSASDFAKAHEDALKSNRISDQNIREINDIFMHSERALTRKEGLPGRPWFMHQIYAPGVYTGYAPKALPSVREAIEQKKWKLAEDQILVVAETLERFTGEIERARALLVR
jgi:N-acetylated-alpha-linked acidic dipeptidase